MGRFEVAPAERAGYSGKCGGVVLSDLEMAMA